MKKRERNIIIIICIVLAAAVLAMAVVALYGGSFRNTSVLPNGNIGTIDVLDEQFEDDYKILKKDSARFYFDDKLTNIPVYVAETRRYVSVRSFLLKAGYVYNKKSKSYINNQMNSTVQLYTGSKKIVVLKNGIETEISVIKYKGDLMIQAKKLTILGYGYNLLDSAYTASGYDEIYVQ